MSSFDIFPWNESFNTGLALIDEQHKKLVQLLNRLANHVAFQSDVPLLGLIFDELADYAVHHFQSEEAVWSEYLGADPMYAKHTQTHDSFVASVDKLRREEDAKPEAAVIEEVLAFLARWLASHILENDRYLAQLVLAMQAGMELESAKSHATLMIGGSNRVLVEIILTIYENLSTNTLRLMRELSERKHAAEALRLAHEDQKDSLARIQALMDSSLDAIVSMDHHGNVVDWNQRAERIFGHTREQVMGRELAELIVPTDQRDAHRQGFARFLASGGARFIGTRVEVLALHANGRPFPVELAISALKRNDRVLFSAYLRDITEQKAATHKIEKLAFYDPLTELPNRRLLVDRLQHALASCDRGKHHGAAILFIDLDNFKTLNETLGHEVGNLLLQQVAQRLNLCLRKGDTVAHLGSDEFVLLLENLDGKVLDAAAETTTVAEKVRSILHQPYRLVDYEYRGSASIGVTLFNEARLSTDEIINQAHIAMNQAKKEGHNTVRFFDPHMQESINSRATLEAELRKALEQQEFELYYQIQVDSALRPLGAEALIRWNHPRKGFVSPMQFIPLAEETGLILPIGHWVLNTACAQINAWQNSALTRDLVLAVNVSPRQFRQPDFVAQVQSAVRHHGIRTELLKLELTEGMLVEDIDGTIISMNALSQLGVKFSMDDFGTGYSSLQYLTRLPLHQIKIDRSFVCGLVTDRSVRAIVQTIIAMAGNLGLSVIAEGVETHEQRQLLQAYGCLHFQGYLFGQPVPVDAFESALESAHSIL